MNFREHFEAWHKRKFGYVGKHSGTAMCITYQTQACQQRWEAWQACADWHTEQEMLLQKKVRASGLLCSVCRCPQFETPAGLVCKNGHGGATSTGETP